MLHAVKSFVFWSQIMLKDLCWLPFGYVSKVVQRQKLFLPELSVICTHRVAPETPVSWFGALEVDRNSSFHFAKSATRGIPCTPVVLLLLTFKSGPWPLCVWPQCSEIWLQQSWGMRPRCGLGRFHLMTGCCTCFTEVRWFYDKKGLHLRIKWNVQERRYTFVSFWKLRCHSATNPPPFQPSSISVLCKLLAEDPRALERSWQRLKLLQCLVRFLCENLEGWQGTVLWIFSLFTPFNGPEHSSTINV